MTPFSSLTIIIIIIIERLFTLICIHVICTMYMYMQLVFCSIPTIIIRGDMHIAHVFLFQCPLPSSCNDFYFIVAFPTLCSSLPVQIQGVSIHTIIMLYVHAFCQMFGLYMYVHYTLPMYIHQRQPVFVLFPSLVPRLHTRVIIERGDF